MRGAAEQTALGPDARPLSSPPFSEYRYYPNVVLRHAARGTPKLRLNNPVECRLGVITDLCGNELNLRHIHADLVPRGFGRNGCHGGIAEAGATGASSLRS